ncbi:MAG: hypothetical protein HPY90_05680 [Syntrophothermus sp.]|uniref:hypothetical protein n=1 Tax=Syntrophothermus sp. TaxID=2736299 RepID=UPI002579EEDE|nr:hypothetical protein [Syntrophothermus sp.]NSW82755.1 hypothetical protein [Syntrophothermus sp.]
MDNLVILLILVAIAVLYFWKPDKKNGEKKTETAQDLLSYEEITSDGLIILPDRQFCAVISVQPINMLNRSFEEQAAIWNTFRNMLHSINIPISLVVQSRRLDMKQYLSQLSDQVQTLTYPALRDYGQKLVNHLSVWSEQASVKNRRYYIYLKLDAKALSSIDSGIVLENESLQRLADSISGLKKDAAASLTREEVVKLARNELDNCAQVICSYLDSMGLRSSRLTKPEIVELLYAAFNRDLSPVALFEDANNAYAFAAYTQSATPEIFAAAEAETVYGRRDY